MPSSTAICCLLAKISADERCSDDDISDSFCSYDLESDGSAAEDPDPPPSDQEERPAWDTDPERLWEVWQIDEVERDADGKTLRVSVLWDWRPTPKHNRYRTWEPVEDMSKTHSEEVKPAERFAASDMQHFRQFCKTSPFGKAIIDASDNYNCVFNALDLSASALGRPGLIPQDVVAKFIADELAQGRDLLKACTWKLFSKLLSKLRASKCDLVVNALKRNLITGGHRGSRALLELEGKDSLTDGLFLVGAYNRNYYRRGQGWGG
ncbi:hypothetical protein PHMEG_00020715 [Phytophthora megakarya]|uniref:Uncharacterized protein n=1 Tax=Phytophthora megakarya TaxID=4795 RepID=A0A225VNP0_9STRA|nr:hypothetical protein PHMEG_00020715 [Phytophthora megakarya]